MLAANTFANKKTYTKVTTFVKNNWEEILIVAVTAYLVEDIIDPDVLVSAAEEGVLV